jgi:predicted AlkP superfamily pyrophosphatase or phosphodiesterase
MRGDEQPATCKRATFEPANEETPMINEESLAAVAAAQLDEHFIHPIYADYGFAQIPQTVRYCLGAGDRQGVPFGARGDLYQQYDTVVLCFVDAFGWRFFERYAGRAPFLKRFVDQGMVAKLTSQFPSTTAAHVTAIHTGLPVGQSGIFEWFYYEPQLDTIIAPLLFSFAGDTKRNTLTSSGADPAMLYPAQTLYQELGEYDVDAYLFQPALYSDSPFTRQVGRGARIRSYRTLPEVLVNLAQQIERQERRSYYFLYIDSVDTIGHLYGTDSPQFADEIEACLFALEQGLHGALSRSRRRTLLLVTADHGQMAIDPATTIYLNRQFPQAERWFRTNRAGRPLVPAGSSRDMFLYIEERQLGEVQEILQHGLAGRADVRRVADLIAQGFFGPGAPSPAFMGRVGNLVILPYRGESIWWYVPGRFEQKYYGNHGGLTRDEMETLLLALPYGA